MDFALSRRHVLGAGAALGALPGCTNGDGAKTAPPTPSDALGDLDATGIAARIRAGEITQQEALEAAIARTERVNPTLNFIASPGYDYGRTRAASPLTGPFAGVPTLIKDLTALAGLPLRFGCRGFDGNVATEQAPNMDALLAAGIVPFGKSTTPEFGLTATTESLLTGATRNPWDPSRSSGGSSGGASAAVASGAVPIAQASDGGGSIRIPASCCGLFGLKVSRGREIVAGRPDSGVSISVSGCVSRSVRDTAAWLAVTEQRGDGATYPPVGMVTGPSQRRLRIIVQIIDGLGREPHPHVKAAIEGVAELCTSLGHEVRAVTLPIDGRAFADAFTLLWAAGAAEAAAAAAQARPGVALDTLLEPLTLELTERYRAAPRGALERAIAHLRRVETQYDELFAQADVLLTPVLAKPPLPIGEIAPSAGLAGFARVEEYAAYTPYQNVAGAPAMSVPLSWSPDDLPIGAHFSSAKGQERRLLELAYELELAAPWATRRPQVWAG